jgi:hypothetical protein
VSVLEVLGVYVAIPGVIVGVIAVLTVGLGHRHRRVGYRPGEPWEYPDQLWAGDTPVISMPIADRIGTTVGGARGTW